jgi:hypothetical protein
MKNYRELILRGVTVFAVAILALFAFAACSDDGDDGGGNGDTPTATAPADGDSPTDAPDDGEASGDVSSCDLVSKEEAADILGEPVDDASTGAAACVYSAESIDSLASVGVSLIDLGSDEGAGEVFSSGKDLVDAPEDISGLGDEAYWDPAGGSVDVRKGSFFLSVSISFADGSYTTDEAKQAALDLAETAVDRLP